jgi:hypothetical protein
LYVFDACRVKIVDFVSEPSSGLCRFASGSLDEARSERPHVRIEGVVSWLDLRSVVVGMKFVHGGDWKAGI